jgi:hypothetical protein
MKEKKHRDVAERGKKAHMEAFERDQLQNFWFPNVGSPANLRNVSSRINVCSKMFSNQDILERILSKDINDSNEQVLIKIAQFNETNRAEDIAFKDLMEADKKQLQIYGKMVSINKGELSVIVERIQGHIYILRKCMEDRKIVVKRQQIIENLYNRLDRVRPSVEKENIAYEAYTTALRENFES